MTAVRGVVPRVVLDITITLDERDSMNEARRLLRLVPSVLASMANPEADVAELADSLLFVAAAVAHHVGVIDDVVSAADKRGGATVDRG